MTNNYDDIINLPHPTSAKHPRMSMYARAAQFAPFAALTGYEETIREATEHNENSYNCTDGDSECLG